VKTLTLTADQMTTVEAVAAVVRERYATETRSRFGTRGGVPALRSLIGAYAAELAVALAIDETWHRGDDMANVISRRADVGDINEVRWTGGRHAELRVYDPDSPTSQDRGHMDRRFWLVTGFPPAMRIHGWALGRDVLRHGVRRVNAEGAASWYLSVGDIAPWPDELVSALTEPRLCPSCHDWHPVGSTCATGWAPWA
jgi:hypothetical protein